MTSILDHFIHRQDSFLPKTIGDVVALRVAQKLRDPAAVAHYATLVSKHSIEQLIAAYRCATISGQLSELATRFHAELQQGSCRVSLHDVRLLAVKVERRSIGAAVFIGTHLEHTEIRHLSSQGKRAESSAIDFAHRIASGFNVESAAIESIVKARGMRRAILSTAITNGMRSSGIPVWPLLKTQLFEGLGYPPLRSRKQLREVILSIWPVLNDAPRLDQALDAVALGALVQIERLFLY